MNNHSFIRGRQLVIIMLMSRTLFNTTFIPGINPHSSIQDILIAIPVTFMVNLMVAIPVVALLRRHPGEDLIACAAYGIGRAGAGLLAFFYAAFLLIPACLTLGIFNVFFSSNISGDVKWYQICIPLTLVCIFGAVKGLETIGRFGLLVLCGYIAVFLVITVTVLHTLDLSYLTPLFYNGMNVFVKSVVSGVNMSFQTILLAMCAPFLRPNESLARLVVRWNALSMGIFLFEVFLVVTVFGPLGGQTLFPVGKLVTLTQISSVERLDALDMVQWSLEGILNISMYLFCAWRCLYHTPLRRWRLPGLCVLGALTCAGGSFWLTVYEKHLDAFYNPLACVICFLFLFALPLLLLLGDVIRKKVSPVDQKTAAA